MKENELLKPRFEVIADYPNNQFGKIGTILDRNWAEYPNDNENEKPIWRISDFPNLFRKLQWWEKRTREELPTFIKSATKVVKPKWEFIEWAGKEYWQANKDNGLPITFYFDLDLFEPATEAEYNEFINLKTN
jgi:hypothetical protein